MIEYNLYQWLFLLLTAFVSGISKSGIPGLGILIIPIMAIIFPTKVSTGILLPVLAFADLIAVGYYRRDANWKIIVNIIPWCLAGLVVGSLIITRIDDRQLRFIIAIIVLTMLVLNFWKKRHSKIELANNWKSALFFGIATGVTTQLANAAGPIMIIYLLSFKLDKNEFIGTRAWIFLILNWIKIPLFFYDGRLTSKALINDLYALPFIILGIFVGIKLLKKIPQKYFIIICEFLVILATIKLIHSCF